MIRWAVMLLLALSGPRAWAAEQSFPLESAAGLRLHDVTAVPETLHGKKGVRVTASEAPETFAVVEGTSFGNGVIEAEIAGAVKPGAAEGARGFVGIAFRLQGDLATYDAFYLRPTNGRADDQVRRNHSAQYISHPAWTWSRLRSEAPAKYESYVDLVPGEWTKVRIEVDGAQARLYVHGQPQPTLVVNDVKTGPDAKGAVALWVDVGTLAHFRNLTVTSAAGR
ncbi:MAG: family 16 glycoside hydrolase [Vicinamibacteria bacterium]